MRNTQLPHRLMQTKPIEQIFNFKLIDRVNQTAKNKAGLKQIIQINLINTGFPDIVCLTIIKNIVQIKISIRQQSSGKIPQFILIGTSHKSLFLICYHPEKISTQLHAQLVIYYIPKP